MAVVQGAGDFKDRHEPSGRSSSDILGGVDADTKAVIRAINDNLNEHIEETGKRFDALVAKVDGLTADVSSIKSDVDDMKTKVDWMYLQSLKK